MSKLVSAATVRITVQAGKAAPTPPVGPALGAKGVKSMDFCKEFNARTADYVVGTPLPTVIKINPDKSFTFKIKTPNASYLIKKAAGVEKGTRGAGVKGAKPIVGKIGLKMIYEIAKLKSRDDNLQGVPLYGIVSGLVESARTLGIEVVA
ncbi:mitochondrial ribosomal protein l11 [Phaffia rhodozyma]|uniref:Large ribosomal subunit protein uL11m n=1 Tax=Phaffia rhodozyma TaxID=264483 RepID=A0A0F7SLP1_PHARH|nr:mitochondrial ribosomal protein l11 [Phaffia rhodozyma]